MRSPYSSKILSENVYGCGISQFLPFFGKLSSKFLIQFLESIFGQQPFRSLLITVWYSIKENRFGRSLLLQRISFDEFLFNSSEPLNFSKMERVFLSKPEKKDGQACRRTNKILLNVDRTDLGECHISLWRLMKLELYILRFHYCLISDHIDLR